ncbi:MAG: hypothetical protein IT320_20620 [Anaerolineae bacterium]|nr:hypothetical protein [Anaerolineae bacterium]
MQDVTTLCLLAVFVLVGFALMSRMLGRMGGGGYPGSNSYPRRGPYNPSIDDPDIQSGGAMGRPAEPTQRSGGSLFPTSGGSQSSGSSFPGRKRSGLFPPLGGSSGNSGTRGSTSSRPQNDDPNITSRGGFGRPKK